MSSALAGYHRYLFQWHCRKFFKFRRYLTSREKDYLEVCFRLAEGFQEVSEFGYADFSYYSYSHRVEGDQVNSSRLAYGSVSRPQEALAAALPVMEERRLVLDPVFLDSDASRFYGLGWDILEEQFKVYFRVTALGQLPGDVAALVEGYALEDHREEGLVSFTYTRGEPSEKKVYLYPRAAGDLPQGVARQARMITDRRGEVPQYDLAAPQDWVDRLNPAGQRIVSLYQQVGEPLDTIAYQSPDRFTLYFP